MVKKLIRLHFEVESHVHGLHHGLGEGKNYAEMLHSDLKLRKYIEKSFTKKRSLSRSDRS